MTNPVVSSNTDNYTDAIFNRRFPFFFLSNLVICFLAYSVLISNELTNTFDGMWQGTRYVWYEWVMRIGRWFWPFIGYGRNHLSPEPFTSILTISLFLLAGCLILSALEVRSRTRQYLVLLLFGIGTSVCVDLSYRYMSPTFGFSVLFAILSVWLLLRFSAWWAWILSTGFFILCLASYQAYIGCAAVLFLACVIHMLLKNDTVDNTEDNDKERHHQLILFFIRTVSSVLIACIAYKLLWSLSLKILGFEVASYQGADSLSIGHILSSLPQRAIDAYREFYAYYTGLGILHHAFQGLILYPITVVLYTLLSVICVLRPSFAKGKKQTTTILLFLFLLPLAANSAMLLSPDSGGISVQMTCPISMLAPILLCLSEQAVLTFEYPLMSLKNWTGKTERYNYRKMISVAQITLLLFVLYGNFLQICVDQHIMLQSRNSTLHLMDRVIADMEKNIYYAQQPIAYENSWDTESAEHLFVFVGKPADNPLYRKDEVWKCSNAYARYGNFWLGGDCATQSYAGLMRDGGYNIIVETNENSWHEIESRDEVKNMPCYPIEGYIKRMEANQKEYIVVRLS